MRHRNVVMVMALAAAAAARPVVADEARTLAELDSRLKPGTEVDVVDREGRVVRGAWARGDQEGVVLMSYGGGSGHRMAAGDVVSVTRHGDSVKNGMLIGAAVGLGSSLLVFGTETPAGEEPICVDTSCKVVTTVVMTAAYAGIGALIDRAIKGRDVVYRAPPGRMSHSVAPYPVRDGVGLRYALRF